MLLRHIHAANGASAPVRRISHWLGLVFLGLWLTACSDSPEEKIVGKWQVADTTEGNVLEFYQDGTVTFEEAITGVSINGDYSFLNEEKVKIELGGILAIAGPAIYTISFSDDRMTLESQNGGDVTSYDKVE